MIDKSVDYAKSLLTISTTNLGNKDEIDKSSASKPCVSDKQDISSTSGKNVSRPKPKKRELTKGTSTAISVSQVDERNENPSKRSLFYFTSCAKHIFVKVIRSISGRGASKGSLDD